MLSQTLLRLFAARSHHLWIRRRAVWCFGTNSLRLDGPKHSRWAMDESVPWCSVAWFASAFS